MDTAELEEAIDVIPRDREIVLFCSCPNEATAAQMALRLRNLGITRIRPLVEGLAGWRTRVFLRWPWNRETTAPIFPARCAAARARREADHNFTVNLL
jgi:hypothetical protein